MGSMKRCKSVVLFFKSLQVKEKFVRKAITNTASGVTKLDSRGKYPKNKANEEDLKRLQDHINILK